MENALNLPKDFPVFDPDGCEDPPHTGAAEKMLECARPSALLELNDSLSRAARDFVADIAAVGFASNKELLAMLHAPSEAMLLALNSALRAESNKPIELRGVSKAFGKKIQEAYDALPAGVREEMLKAGFKIAVVSHMTHKDAYPELAKERPRGWPPEMSWDNADGTVMFSKKRVVVAERRKYGDNWVDNDRAGGVLRHEFGHAVNDVWGGKSGRYSDQAAFTAAYERDVANMSAADKKTLSYFLQSGVAGRDETFADVFALLTGGPANESHRDALKRAFPEVAKLLKKKLGLK